MTCNDMQWHPSNLPVGWSFFNATNITVIPFQTDSPFNGRIHDHHHHYHHHHHHPHIRIHHHHHHHHHHHYHHHPHVQLHTHCLISCPHWRTWQVGSKHDSFSSLTAGTAHYPKTCRTTTQLPSQESQGVAVDSWASCFVLSRLNIFAIWRRHYI